MHAYDRAQSPPNDATVGNRVLVNGGSRRTSRSRRAATGSACSTLHFSSYDFALSDGARSSRSAPATACCPTPWSAQDILLGPAQRADVVVDFRGEPGKDVVLTASPARPPAPAPARGRPHHAVPGPRPRRPEVRVPENLRPIPRIQVPEGVAKTWTFGLDGDAARDVLDDQRQGVRPRTASTTGCGSAPRSSGGCATSAPMTHYVHLHEELWRTVSRNGERPPPWERGLEDTWRLDPGDGSWWPPASPTSRGVHGPLPHARPRGPRDDGPVRGAPAADQTLAVGARPRVSG